MPGASGDLRAQLHVGAGSVRVDRVVIGGREFRDGAGGTLTEDQTYELAPV